VDVETGNAPYPERALHGRAGVTTTPKALKGTAMCPYGWRRQSDEVVVVVKLKTNEDTAMYLRTKF